MKLEVRKARAAAVAANLAAQAAVAARELLAEDGRFCVVLPSDVFSRFRRTAASFGLYLHRELDVCTTPSKPISRVVAEFGLQNGGDILKERLILQENGSKSADYKELTKEFYL